MKKYLILIPLLIIFYSTLECKKDNSTTNILLYNKPLKTIQQYIQGKWRLIYAKGGFCSTCKYQCDNCLVEFTSTNKFITDSFIKTSDTTSIHWTRGVGTFINNDSTYLMNFRDNQGVPWVYVIDKILNDTLIYHDNSSDAMFFHLIKSK